MNKIDRLYYSLRYIENKSIATMGYADWARLIRPDGTLTELEELPGAINTSSLEAAEIVSVASGIAIPDPGMDILRYDAKDYPFVINLDHYTVVENLHLHGFYPEALRIARLDDTPELRFELQNMIYIIKEPPNDNHWMKDFPQYIYEARKR